MISKQEFDNLQPGDWVECYSYVSEFYDTRPPCSYSLHGFNITAAFQIENSSHSQIAHVKVHSLKTHYWSVRPDGTMSWAINPTFVTGKIYPCVDCQTFCSQKCQGRI